MCEQLSIKNISIKSCIFHIMDWSNRIHSNTAIAKSFDAKNFDSQHSKRPRLRIQPIFPAVWPVLKLTWVTAYKLPPNWPRNAVHI